MPRNGQGVYSLPPVYEAVTGETIEAQQHNIPLEDIRSDLNLARPITAGGTGGQSATEARDNLGVYSKAETDSAILSKPSGAATKATPIDADGVLLSDSADSGKTKRVLWSQIKVALKSYFDGVYLSLSGGRLTGNITMENANISISSDGNSVVFFRDKDDVEQGYIAQFPADNSVRIRTNSQGSPRTFLFKPDGNLQLASLVPAVPSDTASKGYVDGVTSGSMDGRAYPRWSDGSTLDEEWAFGTGTVTHLAAHYGGSRTRQLISPLNLPVSTATQNQLNARVSNVRWVGPSSIGSITGGGSWDAPSGYFLTGLSYASGGSAIGLRAYQPQVYINGAWRAFA